MTHVVQRCPSCGVEHDVTDAVACEACGTALRAWCGRHGREAGWLETSACPRCDEEAARPTPPPRVAPHPVRPAASPPSAPAKHSWPGRSPREILRGSPRPKPPEPEPEPEPQYTVTKAVTEVVANGCVWWMVGMVLAIMAGALMGADVGIAWAGGKLFGLAGAVVAAIGAVAKLLNARSRREG